MLKIIRRSLGITRTPSPEHDLPSLSREEMERELVLTAELRKTLEKFQACKLNATGARSTQWTVLLPLELIYLIIDYYSDDLETLRALAGTCRLLSSYCRQYIYRTVIVGPRTTTVGNDDPSFPERFARLLVQAPQILYHIQNLRITMQNYRRRGKFDPLNREEESIAFLLCCMKNLRRLKITMEINWILLPDRLQHAISTCFQSPALNEVMIQGIHSFPLSLLLHVKNLEYLDFCCDAAPPSNQDNPPPFTVQPKTIHLHDPRASTVRYLFGERSSISTSQLSSLSVSGNRTVVSTLNTYLPSFPSLTRLELDPASGALSGVPDVPDLGHLPLLKHLTLTVDIFIDLSSLTLINESAPRWQWVIDTLNTCDKPSTIEELHIIVHTNSPKQTQVYDWAALDSVFAMSEDDSDSWPALELVDISICAQFDFNRGYLAVLFDQFLTGKMVNLVRKGVTLRGRYSPRRFHGQFAQRQSHL